MHDMLRRIVLFVAGTTAATLLMMLPYALQVETSTTSSSVRLSMEDTMVQGGGVTPAVR